MPTQPSLELQLQIAERLPPIPMDFPPLPTLTPPAHEELTLPNGLRVYLMEDHEVPAVRGTLLMRGGQRGSPPDRLGVATISAGVQRAGGSVTHPGPVLDELLEDRGAQIEGGASSDVVSIGFRCLSEDSREVLGIFADVVQRPALPKDKLQLYQAQIINFLEHQNDNPRSIPARELNRLIYGRDSVFARQPTPQQVSALTVDDLRGYLAAWERPDASVLGIVGDFDSCQMKAWVAEYFGGWQPAEGQPLQPPPLPNSPLPDQDPIAGKLFLVNIPGATQTSVAVGEPGIQLLDPDDFPLDVLNDILNSFGGRLFDQIRSREGLAYSIQGGWAGTPTDHPGLFLATAETAQPGQLLAALRSALQAARDVAPTEEEVARAKEETLNSFVFNFASSASQLQRLVSYSLLGIPEDYLFQYQKGIEAVTPEQVLEAARRHLHPSLQTAVVAGDAAKIRPQLEKLGWPIQELTLE